MKKLLLTLTALFGITFMGYAQEHQIVGQIHDEHDNSLPYVSVSLLVDRSDQLVGKGTMSNENGTFSLTSVVPGTYKLSISMVGFKHFEKRIEVKESIDLGKIILGSDVNILGEVSVTTRKPMVSRKIDRYVLNVTESILATGRSSFELLNYAPGVMTLGNNIAINGNTSTKVMVNGRLLRMSAAQVQNYLSNLRSEEIASIEVIPNPGSEYEAEGGGGIINIILKKKRASGLTGTLGLGATTPVWPSYNSNEQLNYGYKGLQVYASHNYSKRESKATLGDRRWFQLQELLSDGKMISKGGSNNYRFGIGYDFSDHHYLGIEYNGNSNNAKANTFSKVIIKDPSQHFYNEIDGDFNSYGNNSIGTLSLNYEWKLDNLGSVFTVLADRTESSRKGRGDYFSHYEEANGVFLRDSIYRNRTHSYLENFNAAVNYTQKWQDAGQLKLGGKYTQTTTDNNVAYEYLEDDQYRPIADLTNEFDYSESILAIYAQYALDWNKTSLQLGLRAEHTQVEGFSNTTGDQFKRSYTDWFPSLIVKHVINDQNTFSLNYSRRLNRATFNILNPFEWRINDYSYVKGNPGLKPQYTHSLQLSYLYKEKYDLTLFTALVYDVFASLLEQDPQNDLVSKYLWSNVNKQYYFGVNLYLPFTPMKGWTVVNNIMLYRDALEYTGGMQKKLVFQVKSAHNINLPKDFKLELSGFYQSRYISGNLEFEPSFSIDGGLNKSLFSNKLNARLLMTDIFKTSTADYKSKDGALYEEAWQRYMTRRLSLQLTYNFSVGKKVKVKRVEAGNATEKNRMN